MQDKKPYKVQFTNDASYAQVPDFLGMKKNRNWALLADHLDRSLMRNKLAFSLGNSSLFSDGLKWTPSGQHVEVTLNGDYIGVYLLTEDIRIDPGAPEHPQDEHLPAANEHRRRLHRRGGRPAGLLQRRDREPAAPHPAGRPYLHRHARTRRPSPRPSSAYIKSFLDSAESDIYAKRQPRDGSIP